MTLIALLIVAGIAAWALWPSAPTELTETTAVTSPDSPTEPPPAASAPAGTPAAQAGDPDAAAAPSATGAPTELTTTRAVWVRVIADGERLLERELPADARIPIAALQTIVIRTGDADAVRLTIAGKDQGSFGRPGQVVTRTFTVRD